MKANELLAQILRKGKAELSLGRHLDASQSFHQGLQLAPENQAQDVSEGVSSVSGVDHRDPWQLKIINLCRLLMPCKVIGENGTAEVRDSASRAFS